MVTSTIKRITDLSKTTTLKFIPFQFRLRFARDSNLRGVLRAGGVVFLLSIVGVVLGYISQVVLARWLGQKQFGIYAYAWSWTQTIAVFGTFGLAQAMLRFFPQYAVQKEWALAAGLLRYGRWMVFAAATLIALCVAFFSWAIGDFFASHYVVALWVAFGTAPLLAVMHTQREMARAFGRPVIAYLPRTLIYPLLLIITAYLLSVYGCPASAVLMMVVTLCALIVIIQVQGRLMMVRLPEEIRTTPHVRDFRVWLQVAFPLFVTIGCRELLTQASLLMLGAYMMPENVAVYFAAARIANLVTFVLTAVNALGASQIARLHAQDNHLVLQRFVSGAIRWIFWPSLFVASFLVLIGESALKMFGPNFTAGTVALLILMLGQMVSASVGPVGYLLNMTGHQRISAWIFAGSTAINIILNALLIPHHGILGAAVATSTGVAIKNIVAFIFVRHRVKIHSFIFFAPQTKR